MDAAQRAEMASFLRLFARHLPCPSCRRHFTDFLDRRLTDDSLATRDALVALLNDAHNEVNARTGKRVWTLAEHRRAYARPRPRSSDGAVVATAAIGVLVLVWWMQRQRIFSSNDATTACRPRAAPSYIPM
jgi:hypothetical protein